MGEQTAELPQQPSGVSRFGEYLKRFKARFSRPPQKRADGESVQAQESTITKDVEWKPQNENLRPTRPVYFHTAPSNRVASIRSNGLFSNAEDTNIGNFLGYSLFFGHEHANRGKFMNDFNVRTTTPDNYVLTVWEGNASLVRTKSSLGKREFMDINATVEPKDIPEEFLRAQPSGTVRAQLDLARRLQPKYLMATIPLDRPTRDLFLRGMVLANFGRLSADQFEASIKEGIFSRPDVWIKTDVDVSNLVHDMVVSVEHRLLRSVITGLIDQIRKPTAVLSDINKRNMIHPAYDALWYTMLYRPNINDQFSAAYLDKVMDFLRKYFVANGVDINTTMAVFKDSITKFKHGQMDEISKRRTVHYSDNDKYPYYGYTNGQVAAMDMMKELGLYNLNH